MTRQEPTAALARFSSGLQVEDLTTDVADRVKLLLLDAIASGLTGWSSTESNQIEAAARTSLGPGLSPLIGRGRLSPGGAVMVNGYLITARSLCDMHQPTLCHVTPVTVPPALAAALETGASGADLLAGLAAGFEATVRIGLALDYTELRSRGWHTTGVVGPIGGVVGAARVAGLDAEHTERAIGLAAAHSAGTFAAFGTPTIKYNQARAALGGYLALDLARSGFLGPEGVLTAEDGGLLGTYSNGGDPDSIYDQLGERWELLGITTRLWPAAAALQGVITIVTSEDLPAFEDVKWVRVGLPPENFEMNGEMSWDTPFHAQLSARFVTAVALRDRTVWLNQFALDHLQDRSLGAFARDRVEVLVDRSLPGAGVSMEVEVSDGSRTGWSRMHPKGHPDDPATWDDVVAKFRSAAEGILTDDRVERSLATVRSLEQVEDAGVLAKLVSSP